MYPVSDQFLAEIRKPHTVVAYSEFWYQGVRRATVPLLSGSVTEDATAAVRRRASLSFSGSQEELVLPATTWTPGDASPLWPIGWEVKVFSGFVYADGTEEYVPCGVYRISKPMITRSANGSVLVAVDAYDRSRQVSRSRFTDGYVIVTGSDVGTALKGLLQNRMPSLQDADFNFMKTDGSDGGQVFQTPQITFLPQDDPWAGAMDMAKSIGAEILFDGAGRPTLRSQPDPVFTSSVFTYEEGEANTMIGVGRSLDDEQAYNGVIAVGNNTDNDSSIPRGEAWDTDLNSPTYYDPLRPEASNYGAVPYFYASDYITTDVQAASAAQAQLVRVSGIIEGVDFSAVGNPAHEAGDVVRITDSATKVDANYLMESYQFALGHAGVTSGTTRRRRAS